MDGKNDKDMMRNQKIAIVLMSITIFVWFKFFMPAPPPRQPADTGTVSGTDSGTQQDGAPSTAQPGQPAAQTAPALEGRWAGLAPIPVQTDPAEDEVEIKNSQLALTFTQIGARLKSANVVLHDKGGDTRQLIPGHEADKPDTKTVYPLGLRFTDEDLGDGLDWRRFDVTNKTESSVTFSLTVPEMLIVSKTYSLDEGSNVLNARIDVQNLTQQSALFGKDIAPAYYLNWGPNVDSGDLKKILQQAIVWSKDGNIESLATKKLDPSKGSNKIVAPEWAAIRSAYYVVALKHEPKPDQDLLDVQYSGSKEKFRLGHLVPRFDLQPQATHSEAFKIYIGPNKRNWLAKGWTGLEEIQLFFGKHFMNPGGIFTVIAKWLLALMNWFHDHVFANYGVAIIFTTLIVRTITLPLTIKSARSMKKMQMLGPELAAIKEKYPDEPQEQQRKQMELYKERGINPLGGCFPMLLQMPIFITLYRVFSSAYELYRAPFVLWITDLSAPDRMLHLPFMKMIPFIPEHYQYINLLPILFGASMIIQQKFMPTSGPPQTQQQKMMMTLMPIIMVVIFYSLASGLSLYFLTSTVLGMIQHRFVHVDKEPEPPKKKKGAVGKGQHFYTAAKARQRQKKKKK